MNELQQTTARAIVNVFETGRILGNYAAVAVLKGDSGHLSYGRSQAALGSGTLFQLLDSYCQKQSAKYAAQLQPYLTRFKNKDVSLDADAALKTLLKLAATEDPVMRLTQDQFFDGRYLAPACSDAAALGISEPLAAAIIYDSRIQGGWALLKQRIGPVTSRGSRDWAQRYIALRKAWLNSLAPPLPSTVYRMDAFDSLVKLEKWNLDLPVTVHNIAITVEAMAGDAAGPGQSRTLRLLTPYLRGSDVSALQQALQQKGLPVTPDGTYGAFTAKLVEQWQRTHAIAEDGAGALTRRSLGLPA
jgi:chitosanase